jgi:hypothetical protein
VGTQHERRVQNPRYGEHNNHMRHCHDPKGPRADMPRSGVRDVQLTTPFRAPVDSFKNTTEGLRSVTVQYTASDEAAELRPAPGSVI